MFSQLLVHKSLVTKLLLQDCEFAVNFHSTTGSSYHEHYLGFVQLTQVAGTSSRMSVCDVLWHQLSTAVNSVWLVVRVFN